MRRLSLIFVLLLGLTTAGWTQGFFKPIRQKRGNLHTTFLHPVRGLKTRLGLVSHKPSLPTLQTPITTPVSVTGYFHRLGNGESWTLPAPAWQGQVARQVTNQHYKRSLESLQLEAQAWGLSARNAETWSRTELENFISFYKALKNVQEVPSRFEPDQLMEEEREAAVRHWALRQPDFVPANYIQAGPPTNYIQYTAPFHPSVKQMRILLVRDTVGDVKVLLEAAKKYPNISINWVTDVPHALKTLNRGKYDVVLADFILEDKSGLDVSMYVWNKKLGMPVICYSGEDWQPEMLFRYNVAGQIPVPLFEEDFDKLFNYLSNIVATGRAYPNGRPAPDAR